MCVTLLCNIVAISFACGVIIRCIGGTYMQFDYLNGQLLLLSFVAAALEVFTDKRYSSKADLAQP